MAKTKKPYNKKTKLSEISQKKKMAKKKSSQSKSTAASKKKKKTNKRKLTGKLTLGSVFKLVFSSKLKILLVLILSLLLLLGGLTFAFIQDLPSPRSLSTNELAVSTVIMDRNQVPLYEIYGDTNRSPLALEELPEHLIWATLSIEDKDFYKHWGFSVQGIIRALRSNLTGASLQGGSTITQQLVKVGLLSPERTWQRKVREAFLTVGTELNYSKDEILEMYLNHIPYGGTAWGVEAAAKTYFDKSARDLTLAESALIAGLPAAPSRFSPFSNPELSKARQAEVLRRMVEEGYISQEEADEAREQRLRFSTRAIPIRAPHFSMYIKDYLTEKYGQQTVERGGLRVTTTLDIQLHEAFQASLSSEIADLERHRVGNAAALVTKPNTGEILAMIGSKNYFDLDNDGQVNVVTRQRQPGSAIKPINYAVGLELKRFSAGTMWLDVPTCFRVVGQSDYCPRNYDFSFRGPVQTRFALGNSYNIPAVKALATNGLEDFIATASAMGIESYTNPDNYGLSLTLGGGEVNMLEMATAFGVLANQGVKVPLQSILEIRDWQGNLLESFEAEAVTQGLANLTEEEANQSPGASVEIEHTGLVSLIERVLHRAPSYIINDILADNSARSDAFGAGSALVIPNQNVSVKTGTTNNLRDNWTVGYTPEYLVTVWVGNNDNSPMNQAVVSGVTGAAPIFNDIMSYLLADKEAITPDRPQDIVIRPICWISGLVSHPDRPCETRQELFWSGTEPGVFDDSYREIWVKEDTGFIPEPGDEDGLTLRSHLILSDPTIQNYCVDCARPREEAEEDEEQGEEIKEPTFVYYPLSRRPSGNEEEIIR